MTRKRKHQPKSKKSIPLVKKKSKISLVVKQQKHPVRRFETYHEKFISYKEIKEFLMKLQSSFPNIIQLQVIGQSGQNQPIVMAVISEGESASNPKMGAMIVAGTNGTEWMAVSSALYLIEQLVKGRNLVRIMDYFIIPCLNPDAYECSLENKSQEIIEATDLATNFPFSLGIYDITSTRDEDFYKALMAWRRNFKFNCPERFALIKTVIAYQVAVKMFISLQGDGTKIMYPFGFCGGQTQDVEDLKKVAKAGKNCIKSRCFQIGSMFDLNGLCFGGMVDYVRLCQSSIKFAYTIHVNKKENNLDPCKILPYGQDVMNCVRFMARNVYMLYHKGEINACNDFFTFIV